MSDTVRFTAVTPNLIVRDMARSTAFYCEVLGSPASGGTCTLFLTVEGVDALHAEVVAKAAIVMPRHTQWYGMREFAIHDPDGHLLTFAERVDAA